MIEVNETIAMWADRGERVATATVVATTTSAPQPSGTKMAVAANGEIVGAVSGGCVESAVVEVADSVVAGAAPCLLRYGIEAEGACDVSVPCGGEIYVWVEIHEPGGLQEQFNERSRAGARAAIVTGLEGVPRPGAKLLVNPQETAAGSLGSDALDAHAIAVATEALWSERVGIHEHHGALLFVDVAAPPPQLIIVGAVDLAAQLSALAALARWRATVVDPRSRFATLERFPCAERVISAWPQDAFAQLTPIDRSTAIAVLTHDPKLDDAALLAALATDAGYIGAMGSRHTQSRRSERLLAAGIKASVLARVAAPIGLDLGGRTAAETALSIMGEIIAVTRGRDGGRLATGFGPIHGGSATPC